MYHRKYYESLTRRVRILEAMIIEGKRDQEILNNFLGNDYYNKYQLIKNKIKDPEYKDIYKMIRKDPNEVKNYIDSFQSNTDIRRSNKQGATKLYEDDEWIVYRITTYPAAQLYGKNTRWCITGRYEGHEERGEEYFYNYIKNNKLDGYYFYINKNDPYTKFCVLQNTDGKVLSIWNAEDSNLGNTISDIEKYNLPMVTGINLAQASVDALTRMLDDDKFDEVIQLINKDVVDLNQYNNENRTILELASLYENENIVKLLLKHGADPNKMSGNGFTPLLNAAIWENYDIVKLLLEHGADPNIADGTRHKTPAFIASSKGNLEMLKLLIKHGADINIKNQYGKYPLDAAISNKHQDVIDYLISNGAHSNTTDIY